MMTTLVDRSLAVLATLPLATAALPAHAATATTTLVSVSAAGTRPDSGSLQPAVSADGRYVAYLSYATDLVPGDTNNLHDVFVTDTWTGVTERVSVGPDGAQADGDSSGASISADGRYVAFSSFATNLVRADGNRSEDVFVHDRLTHTTRRVSVSSRGVQGLGPSWEPRLSADGRRVVFTSRASNLVTGDRNGTTDVFVRDLGTGTTRRASAPATGGEADWFSFDPSISADGRYVGFTSAATNLVPGDTNGTDDVFVHDTVTGAVEVVSVAVDGTPAGDSAGVRLSADGRYAAFGTLAALSGDDTNGLPDVYVRDLVTGSTRLVSAAAGGGAADGVSLMPSISGDGALVAYETDATNVVAGDGNGVADIVVTSLATGVTSAASVRTDGAPARNSSFGAALSADGRWVAFAGNDPELVDGYPDPRNPDEVPAVDVYLRGPLT